MAVPGGNKFFRGGGGGGGGGPIISEKLVLGGTNFRGSKLNVTGISFCMLTS